MKKQIRKVRRTNNRKEQKKKITENHIEMLFGVQVFNLYILIVYITK